MLYLSHEVSVVGCRLSAILILCVLFFLLLLLFFLLSNLFWHHIRTPWQSCIRSRAVLRCSYTFLFCFIVRLCEMNGSVRFFWSTFWMNQLPLTELKIYSSTGSLISLLLLSMLNSRVSAIVARSFADSWKIKNKSEKRAFARTSKV